MYRDATQLLSGDFCLGSFGEACFVKEDFFAIFYDINIRKS